MASVLQRAMPIVGSALGRKMGVQVEVSGRRACTDGECIWIPAFDPQRPEQERLAWGYLSHEAAHVRYTDFYLDYDGSALRHRLTNLLEDIRIEKAISQEYPGAAFSLAEVVRQLVAEGRLSAPLKSDSSVKMLNDALLVILRSEVLGQTALDQEATKAHEVIKACFPKPVLDGLYGLLSRVPGLSSTKAALDLADQIIALFQNLSNEHSESKDSGGDGTDKAENSSGDQKTDSQTSESQDQEDKTDSVSGDEQESDSEEGEGVHPENQSGEERGEESQIISCHRETSDKAEDLFLKHILESTESDWPDDLFESVGDTLETWSQGQSAAYSAVTTSPHIEDVVVSDEDKEAGKDLLWKVKSDSARLAAQLTGLVQAKTLTRDRTGKRGMKIDGKRLHRVALGDGRLFKRRSESIEINAAVHIALDISASMSQRMPLAREAVLSLIQAFKPLNGVSVSASAYPGTREESVFQISAGTESIDTVAQRLAALESHDCTPMATGLWHAVHQVCQTNAERRLILMITDGDPDIDHRSAVLDLVSRCQSSGIDVIGLGINVSSVEALFPASVVVEQLDQLKMALFQLSRSWLLS